MLLTLPPPFNKSQAFPVLIGSASVGGSARATSTVVTFDAAAVAGQLIRVAIATENNAAAPSTPAGYTQKSQTAATGHTLSIYEKIAAGGETSVTITHGNNGSAWIADRIGPAVAGTAGTAVVATTTTPNPPSVTPAGGSKPYLSAAYESHTGALTITNYPSGYTGGTLISYTGPGAFGLSRAFLNVTAASEDPGTFTISASASSVAQTVLTSVT